jgi:hypothetical protein
MTSDQQALLRLYRRLDKAGRETLLSFAEFLVERSAKSVAGVEPEPLPAEPVSIPRPANETVVAAIRRLTATYPMIDRDDLLHEASELMTAHVMQGRPAWDVIDELEATFRRRFERIVATRQLGD